MSNLVRHRKALDAVRKAERRQSSLISALLLIADNTSDERVADYARSIVARCKQGDFDSGITRTSLEEFQPKEGL